MNTPHPTRDDLSSIAAELLKVEREMQSEPVVLSPEELALHLTREIHFQREELEILRERYNRLRESLAEQTSRAEDAERRADAAERRHSKAAVMWFLIAVLSLLLTAIKFGGVL